MSKILQLNFLVASLILLHASETSASECTDLRKGKFCQKHVCSPGSEHYVYAQEHCRKTCGLCTDVTIVSAYPGRKWPSKDCPPLKLDGGNNPFRIDNLELCFDECRKHPECTAVGYHRRSPRTCNVVKCPNPPPEPSDRDRSWDTYFLGPGMGTDSSKSPSECGQSFMSCSNKGIVPLPTSRQRVKPIVGGDATVDGEVPWQVLIHVIRSLDRDNIIFCGGSVLNQQWVLSAAHCFHIRWQHLQLSFGALHQDKPSQQQQLDESLHKGNVIIHPAYMHRIKDNDIALVKLLQPLSYTDKIKPVCLPTLGDYQNGQTGIVTGWGSTKFDGERICSVSLHIKGNKGTTYVIDSCQGGKPSSLLLKACLKVRDCNQFQVNFQITDNMICTYEDGKDACQGDSGGPLVVQSQDGRFVILGIVSKGDGCAERSKPGVYTKVFNYLHWINHVTGKNP